MNVELTYDGAPEGSIVLSELPVIIGSGPDADGVWTIRPSIPATA